MQDNHSQDTSTSQATPQWALVTGASSGIGEEFCRQLAARGYQLVLVARREDRLHALAEKLREKHGTNCLVVPADLSIAETSTVISRRLEQQGINIKFLVNNAGYGVAGRFTEPSWQTHQDFIQVMMTAVCELTWRLLPGMQRMKSGYIINVASIAGLVSGSEGHTLYGASKAFLILFSESLALENRAHGIKVSALCPGFTYSEFHDVTGTRKMMNKMPAFIWLQADDVVRYAIESVQRDKPRVIAIPGLGYRILMLLNRYVPGFGRWTVNRSSKRFRKLD